MSFPTTLQGWAVGLDGVILHTADGGRHWAPQASGTMDPLEGVAFADARCGWAVGGSWGSPLLLATTDGGTHWTPQSSPAVASLNAVDCVDASHAWAVGQSGALLFTTDGGATWDQRYLNGSTTPGFSAVDFSDALHGWAVDSWAGALAVTADGGDSWTEITQDVSPTNLSDVATNGSRVWFAGRDGLVLSRNADGSGVWATEDCRLTKDLYAVTTCGTGVVVGGYAGVVSTRTGAGTWVARWHGIDGAFQGVAFTDTQHGWVAGMAPGGASVALVYATADGGRTWTQQLEDDALNWVSDVAMADAQHGWAAGWGGGIVATSDGSTWTPQTTPTWPAINYYGVACGDAQHAVAVGYPGNGKNLSVTADAGATWTSPASGVTGTLEDVDFGDATHVWAAGDTGAITASADAGATWSPQASGVTSDLMAVEFIDALTGWAAGRQGVILHTSDGGATWAPQSSGTTSTVQSIRFLTPLKGWATTEDGEILQTTDGGASWGNAGSRCGSLLYDLAVADATHAFAIGNYGSILALDVVKPVARAKAPSRVQHRTVTVKLSATDSQSGVAVVEYRVGKAAWKTGTSVKIKRNGKTVVSYRAKDNAGNWSAVRKVTVRISR